MTNDGIELTKRDIAQMVVDIRDRGVEAADRNVAHQVAQVNVIWSFYDSLGGQDLDEPDVTQEEAERILSELPTTYDQEENLIGDKE